MSQLIIAIHGYEMAHTVYPAGTVDAQGPIVNVPRGYHHSWIERILPYFEERNAYAKIDWTQSVYHKANGVVRSHNLRTLQCPSSPLTVGPVSHYAAVHNDVETPIDVTNNGVFFLNSRIRYEDVTDGTSYTMFLGEKSPEVGDLGWMSGTRATLRNAGGAPVAGRRIATRGTGSPIDYSNKSPPDLIELEENEAPTPLDANKAKDAANAGAAPTAPVSKNFVGSFSGWHPGGILTANGDGSVRFVAQTINPKVFQQLANRSDGSLNNGD